MSIIITKHLTIQSKTCFLPKYSKLVYRSRRKLSNKSEFKRTTFSSAYLNEVKLTKKLKNLEISLNLSCEKRLDLKNLTKMSDSSLINLLKPLNVLIYIDNQEYNEKQQSNYQTKYLNKSNSTELSTKECLTDEYCDQLFNAIQSFLTYFLSQKFTIYPTSLDELNRRAWFNTTKLLIVVQNSLDDTIYLDQTKNQVINKFLIQTNNVIIFDRNLLSASIDPLKFVLNTELLKSKIQQKLGNEIVYGNHSIPELTTHYVYTEDASQSIKLVSYLEKNLSLNAKSIANLDDLNEKDTNFNAKLYLKHLNTANKLGRNLIIANVTKSTQPIAESSPLIDGLIVITNQQTEGIFHLIFFR